MEGAAVTLPRASDLSPSLLRFLSRAPSSPRTTSSDPPTSSLILISDEDERILTRRSPIFAAGCPIPSPPTPPTRMQVASAVGGVKSGLLDLRSSVSRPDSDGLGRSEQILAEELPALAKELSRVETVRAYDGKQLSFLLQRALKLDSLIGDVEDAVSSSVTTKLKPPPHSVVSEPSTLSNKLTISQHLSPKPGLNGLVLFQPLISGLTKLLLSCDPRQSQTTVLFFPHLAGPLPSLILDFQPPTLGVSRPISRIVSLP